MAEFKGKVVIVTGGALGIGGVTAEEFANRGALVVVADIDRDAGEVIEGRIRAEGNDAEFVEADVSVSRQCQIVVERAVGEFGGLDILFNNVGIQPPTAEWGVMVGEGAGDIITGEWWTSLFPGGMIVLAVMAFHFIGDDLTESRT